MEVNGSERSGEKKGFEVLVKKDIEIVVNVDGEEELSIMITWDDDKNEGKTSGKIENECTDNDIDLDETTSIDTSPTEHQEQEFESNLEATTFVTNIDSFLKLDPNQIAKEITLKDWKYYKKLKIQDINYSGIDSSYDLLCLHENYEDTLFWTIETILSANDAKSRSKTIKHFILIAEALTYRYDFNAAHAIITALKSYPIQRLNKSWKKLSSNKSKLFKNLISLFSEKDNYKNLTSRMEDIHEVNNICIPYMALFIEDFMTSIVLQNDKRRETLKRTKILVEDFRRFPTFNNEDLYSSYTSLALSTSLTAEPPISDPIEMSSEKLKFIYREAISRSYLLEPPKTRYNWIKIRDLRHLF